MREIDLIVVHCTACDPGCDSDVEDIRQQHLRRGFADVGYHYIIRLDGTVEEGRSLDTVGAHVYGHNKTSIGVAYIGGRDEDTRTAAQKASLERVVRELSQRWPQAKIRGHREMPGVSKACPNFEVSDWLRSVQIARN